MSKILKFNNFITENEATEMGAFTVTPKTVTLVEGSSEGLRKMKETGVITTINIVAPRPGRKETDKLNGISFAVKVNKIEDIIVKLSEQRYNISPDLFNGDNRRGYERIEIVFNQNEDLEMNTFSVDMSWGMKPKSYLALRNVASSTYSYNRSERVNDIVVEYNCESDDQFVEIFEKGMAEIVKELCDVKVVYLKERKSEDNISIELNVDIKERVKEIYTKVVTQFFESGDVDSDIPEVSEIILDLYEETPELVKTFQEVPEDLAEEVIKKAEEESYSSSLVNDLKKIQKVKGILKYI
jgi:hypothetical protein